MRWAPAVIIAALVFFADFSSKALVQSTLPPVGGFAEYPFGGIGIFEDFLGIQFSVVHATNHGAAWSILSGYQYLLLFVRIALIAAVLVYAIFFNRKPSWRLPLALIISGAVANVADYFIYGHVVDMFYFVFWGYDYPVFNIADSAIFIGVASLLILSFTSGKEDECRNCRHRE